MSDLAILEDRPIDAIIGRKPSWIVRIGIILIFIVILLLLTLTWYIKYPDSLYTRITLTTISPPISLPAKVDGKIVQFFVSNGETVTAGKTLILLESSTDYQHFLTLIRTLGNLKNLRPTSTFHVPAVLQSGGLGELQPAVNQLNTVLNEMALFESSEQIPTQSLRTDTLSRKYLQLQSKLNSKLQILQTKLALESSLLAKNKEQKRQGLVTYSELVAIENSYLDKKLAIKDIDIQVELYDIKLNELNLQLAEFKVLRNEQRQQLQTKLSNAHSFLTSQINQWQQKYLITAAADGVVSFTNYWSINQHVNIGDVIVNIVNSSERKIGKMLLKQHGVGKVKIGQQVNISLDSFPEMEYGKLVGKIKSISLIPGVQGYTIDVVLPDPLTTTYGELLPFTPHLVGQAQVVTADKRLLDRFLEKIFYILK
jgi:multidrug resistance efflux pump